MIHNSSERRLLGLQIVSVKGLSHLIPRRIEWWLTRRHERKMNANRRQLQMKYEERESVKAQGNVTLMTEPSLWALISESI